MSTLFEEFQAVRDLEVEMFVSINVTLGSIDVLNVPGASGDL